LAAIGLLRGLELLALGTWTLASVVFLLAQQPLLDHHFVLLTATLAVPAGAGVGAYVVHTPRMRKGAVVAFAGILLALAVVQEQDRLGDQPGDPPGVTRAADQLHTRTGPDELVGTDLPIVAYLADRRVPGQLVDTSFVRLGTGSLTDAEILEELGGVRAVVVGRELANRPALIRELDARYPKQVSEDGVTIYLAP
jgi:hypothetical protein